jgi:hypothetical protein
MATVLDVSLLQFFNPVLAVLFVFSLVYAVLQKTKAVTDTVAINAIIAVMIAFLVLVSETIVTMITFMIPWFGIMIIFLVLMLLLFQIFGAKDSDFSAAVKHPAVIWSILAIAAVIFLASLGQVIPEDIVQLTGGETTTTTVTTGDLSTSSGGFSQNLVGILFNQKVIGLVVVFLIAVFAIAFLSGSTIPLK